MKLEQCTACGGFLPTAGDSCPHCRATRTKLGAVAMVLGSSAIAFTLMACYGAAPCAQGGNCNAVEPSTDTSASPASSVAPPDTPGPDAGGW
ncbi:MAG: hypothetical protein KIT84_38925 [Labilithrix sp.]|nr:hypothetical protein [Labilithrix sp.]MCW5817036.1 hypothetical protein [Labilithrix sp.]